MKRLSLERVGLAALMVFTLATQVFAVGGPITATGNLNITANVQNAISLSIENGAGTALLSTLNFGNVDGIGKTPVNGASDMVRLIDSVSGALVDPTLAVGANYTVGALYIAGSSIAAGAFNARVGLSGLATSADITVNQPSNALNVLYAPSNTNWTTSTLSSSGATSISIAQSSNLNGVTALTNGQSVSEDLALRVRPTDAVGAVSTVLTFTATSNVF